MCVCVCVCVQAWWITVWRMVLSLSLSLLKQVGRLAFDWLSQFELQPTAEQQTARQKGLARKTWVGPRNDKQRRRIRINMSVNEEPCLWLLCESVSMCFHVAAPRLSSSVCNFSVSFSVFLLVALLPAFRCRIGAAVRRFPGVLLTESCQRHLCFGRSTGLQ